MIQAITENFKVEDPAQQDDRGAMLRTIEQVRDQYRDRIQANPWLQEQLTGVYWD